MKKVSLFVLVAALASMSSVYAKSHTNSAQKSVRHVKKHRSHELKNDGTIDVNNSDAKTLMELKGVGTKKAEAIVTYRKKHGKFKSVDDVAQVKGIGDKLLAKIRKNNTEKITAK